MKFIICIITAFTIMSFMSCESVEDVKSNIQELQAERANLSQEVAELRGQAELLQREDRTLSEDIKVEEWVKNNHQIKYVVKFKLKQSHFSLDLEKHLKDAMNAIELEIPVDRDYYNSLSEGAEVVDNFRFGSLLLHGSFGSWKMSVVSKRIEFIK